jgi:hypothetical protein
MTNQQIIDWASDFYQIPSEDVVGLTTFIATGKEEGKGVELLQGALLLVGGRLCYVLYDDESGVWHLPQGNYTALVNPLHRRF